MPKRKHIAPKVVATPSWLTPAICALLVSCVWLVFGQTLGHQFVNYDDQSYVYENPIVSSGLTLHGLTWAFTHSHATNWHPLTTISHMLDCQLFGLKAGGHHFTSVVLHSVATVLVFLVFRQMTGGLWRSAFVAAVFALHPLHVESVAWVAERKDVLSAVFFALTLAAYLRYVRRSTLASYLLVMLTLALGLMSKPMLVTLPFVLLLLDYWPLGRFGKFDPIPPVQSSSRPGLRTFGRLFLEKVPLLLLSALSSLVTSLVQKDAMSSFDRLPISLRVANAVISYVTYIRQMIWPTGLAVFYPYPGKYLPLAEASCAALVLLSVTAASIVFRKKFPYLVVGWFWYLGMLVPVIGIIQVGSQAHADRYTYLPQIGLYLMVTWLAVDITRSWQSRRPLLTVTGLTVVITLAVCAWTQASYWRDSQSLWTRSLAVTEDNALAHRNLGGAYLQKGLVDAAISQHEIAVAELGAGRERRNDAQDSFNPGNALVGKSDRAAALARYVAFVNLGNSLFQGGKLDEAIDRFREAEKLLPDHPQAYNSLGTAYLRKGMIEQAIKDFEKAAQVEPESVVSQNNLAWALATRSDDLSLRNGPKAVELATRAAQATNGKNPTVLHTLAAAYAANGLFPEAIQSAEKALVLAKQERNVALAAEIERELGLYRAHSSYREAP